MDWWSGFRCSLMLLFEVANGSQLARDRQTFRCKKYLRMLRIPRLAAFILLTVVTVGGFGLLMWSLDRMRVLKAEQPKPASTSHRAAPSH
jgi:nitrate reductase NapE component